MDRHRALWLGGLGALLGLWSLGCQAGPQLPSVSRQTSSSPTVVVQKPPVPVSFQAQQVAQIAQLAPPAHYAPSGVKQMPVEAVTHRCNSGDAYASPEIVRVAQVTVEEMPATPVPSVSLGRPRALSGSTPSIQQVSGVTPPPPVSHPFEMRPEEVSREMVASSWRPLPRVNPTPGAPVEAPGNVSMAPVVSTGIEAGRREPELSSPNPLPLENPPGQPMAEAAPMQPPQQRTPPMQMTHGGRVMQMQPPGMVAQGMATPGMGAPAMPMVPPGATAQAALPVAGMGGYPVPGRVPRELNKRPLPPYVIEPPDILRIQVRLPLKPRYVEQPIDGNHLVRPDGTVNLGIYGSVRLAGLTLDQARYAIADLLRQYLQDEPETGEVDPALGAGAGAAGALAINAAPPPRQSRFTERDVNIDVVAYNSKVYYVITDGAGYGEQVFRLPVTGNETVLDAISQIYGLPAVASKKSKIWVARAHPGETKPHILPVDWVAVTQCGTASSNYQLMPGDRVYVKADPLTKADTSLARILSPIERLFGTTLLGASTVNTIRNTTTGTSTGR